MGAADVTETTKVRVVLADDERLVREAVAMLLDLEDDIEVVAQAGDVDTVLRAVSEHRPDIVVLDVEMPGGGGIDALTRLAASTLGTRCIVLTRHARPGVLRRALAAGALGLLAKSAPAGTLAEAVRKVAGGQRYVDAELALDALTLERCPLSGRELEVLERASEGMPSRDIAAAVSLSEGTVRNYLSSVLTKLGVSRRDEATAVARESGWI